MSPEERQAAERQWRERYRTGPAGILVYRPRGGPFAFPRRLATELASNLAGALVACFRQAGRLARHPLGVVDEVVRQPLDGQVDVGAGTERSPSGSSR
jgi:hypothetical protein